MNKFIILSIIAVSLLTGINSCTTYDEGPGFTILPADARIKGTWEQTEYYKNDELQGDAFKIEFTFNSDGLGTRSTTYNSITLTDDIDWQLNDDKTVIMFKKTSDTEWDETTILRLTNKELWIEDTGLLNVTRQFRYEKV